MISTRRFWRGERNVFGIRPFSAVDGTRRTRYSLFELIRFSGRLEARRSTGRKQWQAYEHSDGPYPLLAGVMGRYRSFQHCVDLAKAGSSSGDRLSTRMRAVGSRVTDMMPADTDWGRREALLLATLRLSRDEVLLPELEDAVVALDSGHLYWSLPADEREMLNRLLGRLDEVLRYTGRSARAGGNPEKERDRSTRRSMLLLSFLRVSRDPVLRSALDVKVTALDDGRCPPAEAAGERELLKWLRGRAEYGLDPVAIHLLAATLPPSGGLKDPVLMPARVGRVIKTGTSPPEAEALSVGGEILALMDNRQPVEAGMAARGWTLAAQLALGPVGYWQPAYLLALQPPDGERNFDGEGLVFVAVGGALPERWPWYRVKAQLTVRRLAAEAAEEFVRAAERADPSLRAERWEATSDYLQKLRDTWATRKGEERRGDAILQLLDGRPVRVDNAVLESGNHSDGTLVTAHRVDANIHSRSCAAAPPEQPWATQIWIRCVDGGPVWRRGRLKPEPGRFVFVDQADASCSDCGGGTPLGMPEKSRLNVLEADLLVSTPIRSKAAASVVYARLLLSALTSVDWRHIEGRGVFSSKESRAAEIAAAMAGSHANLTCGDLFGIIDEEVVLDLEELGWVPAVEGPFGLLRESGDRTRQ